MEQGVSIRKRWLQIPKTSVPCRLHDQVLLGVPTVIQCKTTKVDRRIGSSLLCSGLKESEMNNCVILEICHVKWIVLRHFRSFRCSLLASPFRPKWGGRLLFLMLVWVTPSVSCNARRDDGDDLGGLEGRKTAVCFFAVSLGG